MAKARFWFLNPIDAIDAEAYAGPLLGSVVKDYEDPQSRWFPGPGRMFPADREERPPMELSSVQLQRAYGRERTLGGGLTSLVDVQRSRTDAQTITLNTAKKMTYRRLSDAQQVFDDLRQDTVFLEKVRPWCKSALRTASACMIVGLLIFDDTDIDAAEEEIIEWREKTTLPLARAAITGLGVPTMGIGDLTQSCSIGRGGSSGLQGRFDGAKIVGLEYRWIHGSIISRDLSQAEKGPTGAPSMLLSGDENKEADGLDMHFGEGGDDWPSVLLQPRSVV